MLISGVERTLEAMQAALGAEWTGDEDENLRFCAECAAILEDLDGGHLMGDPEFVDGKVRIRIWLDQPLTTFLELDELAYAAFARIARDFFCVERHVEDREIVYRFITGNAESGTFGEMSLVGPHASDFAEYYEVRRSARRRFHA